MVCGQLGEGGIQFTLSHPLLLILLICFKCHLFGQAFLDHLFSVGALLHRPLAQHLYIIVTMLFSICEDVFIYLCVTSLSFGMPNLQSLLQHVGSLVAACEFSVAAWEI